MPIRTGTVRAIINAVTRWWTALNGNAPKDGK